MENVHAKPVYMNVLPQQHYKEYNSEAINLKIIVLIYILLPPFNS